MTSTWNPQQYDRFERERYLPFEVLLQGLALTREEDTTGGPALRALDLGCGTGDKSADLHRRLPAGSTTLGVDDSETMLEKTRTLAASTPGLSFERATMEGFLGRAKSEDRTFDLVVSNAALHWVPDHASLLPALRAVVAPGGTLAVQMPDNLPHPSHWLPVEVSREEPFRTALGGWTRVSPVVAPEWYAERLVALGFESPRVELRVFTHELKDSASVVEWVKGSLLTDYARRLSPELYADFVQRYSARLLEAIGVHAPYFYTFRRLYFWARLPDVR